MPDADYTEVVTTTFTRPFYETETELCVNGRYRHGEWTSTLSELEGRGRGTT